jgi:peroxiredoxin
MATEPHDLMVGDKAPEFSLPNQDGDNVSLKSLKG